MCKRNKPLTVLPDRLQNVTGKTSETYYIDLKGDSLYLVYIKGR